MARAFFWIVVAYGVAGGVAVAVGHQLGAAHPLAVAAWADLAATLVIFAFSFAFRNSSFYDAYWSVAPMAIVLYWAAQPVSAGAVGARQLLTGALVWVWGARLTFNWARGWGGLGHEDWRYVDLQEKTGRAWWLVSLLGVHLFPTLQVFLGLLPAFPAVSAGSRPLGPLDALGVAVTAGAIWIEARADRELRSFRLSQPEPGAVLDTGLWRLCRHPNYFGEMGFWWGLWLLGLAADPAWWWTVIGPAAITVMFAVVSLPMIETRMRERRPGFAAYAERTSLVVPWPPRRS